MKLILPVALAFLAVACAAPKPGTAAHQALLEKEARENFYAMKEQERKSAPHAAVAQAEPPAKVRLKPFTATTFEFSNPFASTRSDHTPAPPPPVKPIAVVKPTPKSVKPIASTNPFARYEHSRPADDTVYLYDMPHGPEPTSTRYRAYKAQYARELAKRPEDLTSEEREWVRKHYRD